MAVWMDPPAFHGARAHGRPVKSTHLMADTTAELVAFADSIGSKRSWIQHPGTYREHYDLIGMARIKAAIAAGAEVLDRPEFIARYQKRRAEGYDGSA